MGRTVATIIFSILIDFSGLYGQPKVQESHSLRAYCPTPADQGSSHACQSYAAVFALSIGKNVRKGLTDKDQQDRERYSASFLYNILQPIDGNEPEDILSIQSVLGAAVARGNLPVEQFPEAGLQKVAPDRAQMDAAQKYRGASAWQIPYDSCRVEDGRWIKDLLKRGIPVIVQVELWRSFTRLGPNHYTWKRAGDRHYLGVHSLVVTGFDERTQTFEVLNSWGTGWGNGGFANIHYRAMGSILLSAYIIVPPGAVNAISPACRAFLLPIVDSGSIPHQG